jgi:nucleotide-binding universal stress UspA family protein
MTRKLERILIAVDETPSSSAAIEQGLAIALDENAEVVFAHVASILGEKFMHGEDKPDRVPTVERIEVLSEAASAAEEAGVPCTTELLIGYPPKQLALLAEELDVDLVVVGSRHLSGLKRFFLGSTSRTLLTESTRPILVVPEHVLEPALT